MQSDGAVCKVKRATVELRGNIVRFSESRAACTRRFLCAPLQAQQHLSRLQAAEDAHSSNIAARDAFVRETAAKMGIMLPGEPQQGAAAAAAAAAGGRQQPLPPAALSFFRGELDHREGQLQSELGSLREAHRY